MMIKIPLPTGEYIEIPEDNMTWEDDLKWLRSFEPKIVTGEGYKVAYKYSVNRGYKVDKPRTEKQIKVKNSFGDNYDKITKLNQLKNGKPHISNNGIINPIKLNLTNF